VGLVTYFRTKPNQGAYLCSDATVGVALAGGVVTAPWPARLLCPPEPAAEALQPRRIAAVCPTPAFGTFALRCPATGQVLNRQRSTAWLERFVVAEGAHGLPGAATGRATVAQPLSPHPRFERTGRCAPTKALRTSRSISRLPNR
jgi:hypothetical protein